MLLNILEWFLLIKKMKVDKYFVHFEKVAENLKWPKEHWTLLLQSVFYRQTREIYSQLSVKAKNFARIVLKSKP